jgi:hypothetical protein
MKSSIFIVLTFLVFFTARSQQQTDSMAVYAVLEEIFTVCNSASPEGENSDIVIFDRLAQYILYNGSDLTRKNKVACDYNKSEDRKIVNDAGIKIKSWLEKIETYKLTKYNYAKEGSLDKYVMNLTCKSGATNKEIGFGFIKIKNNFYLAEIK